MREWEPIVKKQTLEPFYVEEAQSKSIVGSVFIGIGLMILASFIAMLFYWAYLKEKMLFIALFSALIFLFAMKMVILVAVIRHKLNPTVFKVYMGSTVFVAFFSLFNIIFFSIKSYQRTSSASSSSSSSSTYYAPAPTYTTPSNDM